MSQSRHAAMSSLAMIGAGAAVAIVPATLQAVGARLFTTDQQAGIALAIGIGVFVSAVLNAVILEARLADPLIGVKSYLPIWATASGVVGGLLLIVAPTSPAFVSVAIPLIMTGLQLGRTHAITDHRWVSELVTAAVLGVGCLTAFVVSSSAATLAVAILGVAVILAHAARAVGAPHKVSKRPSVSRASWVGAETAVVAMMPLALNAIVLLAMSAADAVAFRLVLTVLGILQPLLGYLRTRLLGHPSVRLTWVLSGMTTLALVSVVVADLAGLFEFIFSDSWDAVPLGALVAACGWKAVSIPSTIPFASMRRKGLVREVFIARSASTGIYLALGSAAAFGTQSLTSVYIAFMVAELTTFAIYAFSNSRS